MGRNKFSQSEFDKIGKLLRKKCKANRFQQKEIRHLLRVEYEFNISDFNVQGQPFGYDELQEALKRGAIQILDDATIADMKARRLRDKQKDAEKAQREAAENGDSIDWQQALKEWNEWEENQSGK
jgi:hypothetical protein